MVAGPNGPGLQDVTLHPDRKNRRFQGRQIPYLVAGCGGHSASAVTAATHQHIGDTVFEKSMKGFGYLVVTANTAQLSIEMIETTDGIKKSFDKVTVEIASHRVS